MANIGYAGLYFGIDEDIGYTISLYKPDGTSAHFICIEDLFYGTTTGWHEADRNIMTHRVRPVLAPDNITHDKAMVYPGDKIIHDNSGTWANDYIEYLIEPYNSFWDSLDIENLPVSEDGELLPEYAGQLKSVAEKGLELIKTKPQGEKGVKTEKPKDKSKQEDPPEEPVKPKPQPPHILLFMPHGSPETPPVSGDPPPALEEGSPPKGRWRRKRKNKGDDPALIDDTRDCEDFEDVVAEEKEKEVNPNKTSRREYFPYVFVLEKQVWVTSYYANIFIFAGVAKSGKMKIFFAFITAERALNVPWQDMLETLAAVCNGMDYFIYKDYHNVVEMHLKEVFPNAVFYDSIWSIASDAPIKNRMEEIHRLYDRETSSFWASPGELATTAHLQDAVEKFICRLIGFFFDYSYESKLLICPDFWAATSPNPQPEIIEQNPAIVEETDEDVPTAEDVSNTAVNYCFVFERQMWLTGGIQQRIAVFNQVTKGTVVKSVIIPLPEIIDNSAWENVISKVASHLDAIDYILFRGCSVNIFSIDKSILPNAVWCASIADFDMNETFRAASNEKLNLLENHISSLSSNCGDVKQCCTLLKNHLELIGIAEIIVV